MGSFSVNTLTLIAQDELPGRSQAKLKADTTVSLVYNDTLTLPSFTNFDLHVKMRPAADISAISMGFYFPKEYIEITGMELAQGTQGFQYFITDSSLFRMAWSNINPLNIKENDTIITINMRLLDASTLSNTIRLELYELSEFADQSANIIDGVLLEIPEIKYRKPPPQDTNSGFYVRVFPNPFDDFTTVDFTLKTESTVTLSLINQEGQKICEWQEENYAKGNHQVKIYALDQAQGIYLLKFEIRNSEAQDSRLIKILSL